MKLRLSHAGYILDESTNVWSRLDYGGIAYSDGDEVESRIAGIIEQATDLSVLSSELRQHCTDWTSLYHLSRARANILRPFESDLRGDVLEVGAGCGAITRYLGECGGNIVALEGSPRRAAIARSRTRDLENVAVVSDSFDQFRSAQQFDVITLIGVLEYANLFTAGDSPALSMLGRVRSLLKPDGKLILAIENQLGLKYFAGSPEDHLGAPMYGIEDRYLRGEPRTYGRNALREMLAQAGYAHAEFMAPFPDYKSTISIVTEAGFDAEDFDGSAFAWQSVRRDSQLPPVLAFSPELVWPVLAQNGLALDLANSFLIVADVSYKREAAGPIYAWHFSTERAKEFCKQASFVRADNGSIEVHYRLLSSGRSTSAAGKVLRFSVPEKDEYVQGSPLSQEFIRIISRDGWQIEEVGEFFRRYMHILESVARSGGGSSEGISANTLLPGECFDFLPQNIIINDSGAWRMIDEEWSLIEPIPACQLIFRAAFSLVNLVSRIGCCSNRVVRSPADFFQACFASIEFYVTNEQLESLAHQELAIHAEVSNLAVDRIDVHSWMTSASLPRQTLSQAMFERDAQIARLTQSLLERDGQVASLLSSISWRITKPLRVAGAFIRGCRVA